VEIDADACKTLNGNRPGWTVLNQDITTFDAKPYKGVDLVAAGLPCPPFSLAGQKRGEQDERNLFPAALRIIDEVRPKAVMIENVRGLLDRNFTYYRELISERLQGIGYETRFELLNAADFGVPQSRPRVFIIALKPQYAALFEMPQKHVGRPPSVGETIFDLVASNGWVGAAAWRDLADGIAPAIVGGSKKHGGPDLGPTRARAAWAILGVDGKGIADTAPEPELKGMPRLTVPMVSRIQGFPDDWTFSGRKTAAYRQVGNALPPPLAFAVGKAIFDALKASQTSRRFEHANQERNGVEAAFA
jgi:DNA (cytosine-5)-methyltransferase 1